MLFIQKKTSLMRNKFDKKLILLTNICFFLINLNLSYVNNISNLRSKKANGYLIAKKQGRIECFDNQKSFWYYLVDDFYKASLSITGSQMVLPKRRFLVASLLKNSFWRMGELQPVHSLNPYNSSSMPVRFWEVPKKNKRSILTSCAVRYPERTKVATSFSAYRVCKVRLRNVSLVGRIVEKPTITPSL